MQKYLKEFQNRDVQLKVVSFAPPEMVRDYTEHFHWKFDVYSDPQREIYKLFGLARAPLWKIFHPKSVLQYSKFILQGKKVQKTTEDIQQMGGDFLIDSEGRLRFIYRSQRPDDRPSIVLLLEQISKLGQK